MLTQSQIEAALAKMMAIADAIRELGSVPSGVMYAQVCDRVNINEYKSILKILEKQKLITVKNDLIEWIGPKA